MEVKKDQKISLEELKKMGWRHLDYYADCLILGKETKRVLFDPEKERVFLVYKKSPYLQGLFL